MPRRKITPRSVQAQVEAEIDQELQDVVAAIAAEEGLAKGAQRLSPNQEVRLWGQRDPLVDYDTLKQQLMTGTVPPELYDPQNDRRLALLQINKAHAQEWAALLAGTAKQPLDDDMASQVAELAEWPGRLAVIRPYANDPEAYVAKANSINQRWMRQTAQLEMADAAPSLGQRTASPVNDGAGGARPEMSTEREAS